MNAKTPHTPLRILYVITDLQVGGVPLHLLRLAKAMQESGHTVRVISLAPPGPVSEMLQSAGVETFHGHARGMFSLTVLWRLRREISRFAPDVVHSFLFHANMACRMMCATGAMPARKLLCEIQTVEIERRWHLWVDGLTQSWCRLEIGNSPSVIEHLQKMAGIPHHKLKLVCGAIDTARFENAQPILKSSLGISDDCRTLLWVGRLDPVKGLSDLLEAMPDLLKKHSVHLFLAGEGPEYQALKKKVEQLGLNEAVTFLGVRHDVPELLKSSDVFVFPSYTEGLPNALLEAMAAARPIVCTDIPGNRDLIKHGQNGLLLPVKTPKRLAAAIDELLSHRERADKMANCAHQDVVGLFSFNNMINNYLNLYYD